MKGALLLLAIAACSRGGDSPPPATGGGADSAAGTPVRVASVRRATLSAIVTAPGRTDALRQLRVRAPFIGTLVELRVADGDRVAAGQELGVVVSRNSEAALAGAQAMVDAARTPAEQADAQRALELARQALVRRSLRAPESGVVLSHAANQGDLVNEGDEVLTIAAARSIVFVAEITQRDLPRIRPGQPVTIAIAAQPAPLAGRVHAILPAASPDNFTAPVRVDLAGSRIPVAVGWFGTARIVVSEVRDALVVPAPAVLRDDIYGTSRVALVTSDSRVRWVVVTPGIAQDSLVQVTTPLVPGDRVIVSGQVGLAEGAAVQVLP